MPRGNPPCRALFIVSPSQNHINGLADGLNSGLSHYLAMHHLRTVLTAYAIELALHGRVGHHGYNSRYVELVVVSDRLIVIRRVTGLSGGPAGQAVRFQADRRAICAGNIALHSFKMSSDSDELSLPENKSTRARQIGLPSTSSILLAHVVRFWARFYALWI